MPVSNKRLLCCHPERHEVTVKDLFIGAHAAIQDDSILIFRCPLREPQDDIVTFTL